WGGVALSSGQPGGLAILEDKAGGFNHEGHEAHEGMSRANIDPFLPRMARMNPERKGQPNSGWEL
ncbi:MAG: hypothetical protein ABI222_15000, partial [Opitutaceae bacterium]